MCQDVLFLATFAALLGSFLDLTAIAVVECKHAERWGEALYYLAPNNN